jgi:hypothetical protein
MPDDKHDQPTTDAITALQNALLLRPAADKDKPTILSTNPRVWGNEYCVINIGPLLGIRPTMAGRPADLEHGVALAFQSAAWPLQRIAEQFRPDLKDLGELDIALLADDGQCLVAVDVKRTVVASGSAGSGKPGYNCRGSRRKCHGMR